VLAWLGVCQKLVKIGDWSWKGVFGENERICLDRNMDVYKHKYGYIYIYGEKEREGGIEV
jgi:hypothetical protein